MIRLQNKEFVDDFVAEATEHVNVMEAALLDADRLDSSSVVVAEIFRAVHSIKGTAGLFGLVPIIDLAHAMETVLSFVRKGAVSLSNADVDTMLEANDKLRELIGDVMNCEQVDVSAQTTVLEKMLSRKDTPAAVKGSFPADGMRSVSASKTVYSLEGYACEALKNGLAHAHHFYCLHIGLNRDIPYLRFGPIKLLKKIQSVGVFVDMFLDHSEINSLDDVLHAADNGTRDVGLSILMTTLLDVSLLSNALDIPATAVREMNFLGMDVQER